MVAKSSRTKTGEVKNIRLGNEQLIVAVQFYYLGRKINNDCRINKDSKYIQARAVFQKKTDLLISNMDIIVL